MRREFSLILFLCIVHLLWAIDLDKENTLGFDIQGTARYVGMAGAVTLRLYVTILPDWAFSGTTNCQ